MVQGLGLTPSVNCTTKSARAEVPDKIAVLNGLLWDNLLRKDAETRTGDGPGPEDRKDPASRLWMKINAPLLEPADRARRQEERARRRLIDEWFRGENLEGSPEVYGRATGSR